MRSCFWSKCSAANSGRGRGELKKHKKRRSPRARTGFFFIINAHQYFSNQLTSSINQTNYIMSDTYKPTEHGGLKEDGTPDKRVGTGREFQDILLRSCILKTPIEFAQGKVDPVEAGKQGGSTGGNAGSSSSGSGGSAKGGKQSIFPLRIFHDIDDERRVRPRQG
jgi:hypothetical protein